MASNNQQNDQNGLRGTMQVFGHMLTRRDGAILLIFIILAIWICTRLFALTVVDAKELSEQGSEVRTSVVKLTARRGTIYDRNGSVLAASVKAITIYANPSKIDDPHKTAEILHDVLGGSAKEYYEVITADPEATFVYIAKKVNTEYKQQIHDANQEYIEQAVAEMREHGDDIPAEILTPLTGIEFLTDTRREYPKGNIGAQVIGAVDDEGRGISGLEQTYDSILCGIDGRRVVEEAKRVSQNTAPLPMIDSVVEDVAPVAGSDIVISLDIEMQQYLEENLKAVADQRKTGNASAILLDGSSGEIVASASIPLYDREKITEEEAQNGATNAKAITLPYEPGSTFKSIIAGVALEHEFMTAEDTIYCPSYLNMYDWIIKDSVERPGMDMSLRQIIADSSNIGVSLIEAEVGDELYYEYLQKCGLGDFTHVDYPSETPGNLADLEDWSPVQAANIAFGQGVEVSLLQMASIYGAIANDGVMIQPHFLVARPQYDAELNYDSKRVFKAKTARELEDLLRSCVTDGYGADADIEGYDAVGKTGTAEIGGTAGGYSSSQGSYICSFVGYIDNSSSNYVFMSSFENPTNYSDSPATTFFSVVMSFVANRYMILPQEDAFLATEIDILPSAHREETSAESALERPPALRLDDIPKPDPQEATRRQQAAESAIAPSTPTDWVLNTSG